MFHAIVGLGSTAALVVVLLERGGRSIVRKEDKRVSLATAIKAGGTHSVSEVKRVTERFWVSVSYNATCEVMVR